MRNLLICPALTPKTYFLWTGRILLVQRDLKESHSLSFIFWYVCVKSSTVLIKKKLFESFFLVWSFFFLFVFEFKEGDKETFKAYSKE